MATMIISEKAKAAKAIADALGSNKTIRKKGFSVYYIPSQDVYVVPLRGHIMQYENTPQYKKWDLNTNRSIITDNRSIAKIPNSYARSFIQALKEYAKLSNRCIIGTDADVEGAVIGLMDALPFVRQANKNIQVDQMWLNTLQKKDIVKGYQNTIPPKWSWAFAGESRAKIDAIIGFSATREVSLALRPILNSLGAKFASIGRVQTSLLYLLYEREELIRHFKPELYWSLTADLIPQSIPNDPKNKKAVIRVTHGKSPFRDKAIAEQIHNKVKNEQVGTVARIKKTPKKVTPPVPLNTSKALMLLTRKLKISANQALKTMENLYLNKIISYPRTDSDVYKPNFDHLQYLQKFIITSTYGKYTQKLFSEQRITPTKGRTDAGDHPPITPIMGLDPNSPKFENDLQKKVYNLIARHYLALFSEDAEEAITRVQVLINGEPFNGKMNVLIKEGFYEIAPFLKPKYDLDIPITKGQIHISKINYDEKESQPPPRYTDTTLLKLMEQKNLGTKSTRPTHIETLEKRLYIKRVNRVFYVLDLGYMLIDSLKDIWLSFLDPSFTKKVEDKLDEVKSGKRKMDDVVNEVRNEFLELFDKFRQSKTVILQKISVLKQTGNVMRGRNNQILKKTAKKYTKKGTKKTNPTKYRISNGKAIKTNVTKIGNPNNFIPPELSIDSKDDKNITTSMCPVCKKSPMTLVISQDRKKKFMSCNDKNCKTYLPLPRQGSPRLLKQTCQLCGFNIVKITKGKRPDGKSDHYWCCPVCFKKSLETKEPIGLSFKCKDHEVVNGRCRKKKKS